MTLGRALARTVEALRFKEDFVRLRQLGRRVLSQNRVVVPLGPPEPPAPELGLLLSGDDRSLDVAAGALLVAQEDDPGLDVERALDEIDALACGLRKRLAGLTAPHDRLASLNRYFFEELGFTAAPQRTSRYSEDRLADLLLPHVLRRRRGHCVGLSSAYLALGYRAGLPLFGVSAPGHFFVRWEGDGLRQNVELTALGAAHSDEHYVERFRIGQAQVDRGVYLQNLRRREVLVEILNNRANFYWDRGDEVRASRDLDRVVQASHNFARAHAGRGFIRLQQGDLEAALGHLEKALALDPEYARAHLLLGQVQLQRGWLPRASESFERAVRLDSANALAATYLGRIHSIRGAHDRAIEWHERALQSDPRCHTAWNHLGRSRAALGDLEGARAAFREGLRLLPGNLTARENLVLLVRGGGRLGWSARASAKGIRRDYERLLPQAPRNDRVRIQYVRFLLGAGLGLERAVELAREVAQRTPTTHHLEILARVLLRLRRKGEALEHLERACTLDAQRGGIEAERLASLLEDARTGRL